MAAAVAGPPPKNFWSSSPLADAAVVFFFLPPCSSLVSSHFRFPPTLSLSLSEHTYIDIRSLPLPLSLSLPPSLSRGNWMVPESLLGGEEGEMGWSRSFATNAYLDTLKLCKDEQEGRHDLSKSMEPEMNEFISALAAGMSAQLIVEVSTEASKSTIALAAAARQTGGRLVCILPEPDTLEESKEAIEESGLTDMVEFKVGDPYKLLPKYENVDFSLVDCKMESNKGLLSVLDVNPNRAVVVANHLEGAREGMCKEMKTRKGKGGAVRTMKHPIGNGMEVTVIGEGDGFGRVRQTNKKRPSKSRWVMKVDEESGEEHIFRVPKSH